MSSKKNTDSTRFDFSGVDNIQAQRLLEIVVANAKLITEDDVKYFEWCTLSRRASEKNKKR